MADKPVSAPASGSDKQAIQLVADSQDEQQQEQQEQQQQEQGQEAGQLGAEDLDFIRSWEATENGFGCLPTLTQADQMSGNTTMARAIATSALREAAWARCMSTLSEGAQGVLAMLASEDLESADSDYSVDDLRSMLTRTVVDYEEYRDTGLKYNQKRDADKEREILSGMITVMAATGLMPATPSGVACAPQQLLQGAQVALYTILSMCVLITLI